MNDTIKIIDSCSLVKSKLEIGLARPPSAVGRRLKPEQDLAKLFGVGRYRIRQAISYWVSNGVLVRRHGSGTYVRKMPALPTSNFEAQEPCDLFVENTPGKNGPTVLQPHQSQVKLKIGLWGEHQHHRSSSNQLVAQAIEHQLTKTGHAFELLSTSNPQGHPRPTAELAQEIKRRSFDGFLVANAMERFIACTKNLSVPSICTQASMLPIRYEPVVLLNIAETAERAVRLLADQGCHRPAMLTLDHFDNSDYFIRAYRRAISEAGLTYQKIISTDLKSKNLSDVFAELFESSQSPDSLYVADDHLMAPLEQALSDLHIVPGRDLAVITLANTPSPTENPMADQWSRLEFDLNHFGAMAVDTLLRKIQTADNQIGNILLCARWKPSTSHYRAES